MTMRVIMAGGGTGGHIIPALAIAHELRSSYAAEVLFIGTPRGMESRLVPEAGFDLEMIKVGALKGVGVATRMKTLVDIPRAIWSSRKILQRFKADVVIGVGGYASGPAMLAAIMSGTPTLAFESNFVPGFANRVVARFVSAAAVHFNETAKYFRNAVVTGVPVRKEFFAASASASAARQGDRPVLLVTGGSQGAKALNRAVRNALPGIKAAMPNLFIIHQTGTRDFDEVKAAYEEAEMAAEISPFISDMPRAFARANLLICRAGASTVAEITAAGKPAIFVPFPFATDNHQHRNAEALASRGAAMLIPESQLTAERLTESISQLFKDPTRLKKMSDASKSLSHVDAAGEVARMAAKLAGAEK